MTIQSKTVLIAQFKTGDVPAGANYTNLIQSQVNLAETAEQSMAGPINATEVITSRLSAGNANIVGTLSMGAFNASIVSASGYLAAPFLSISSGQTGDFNILTSLSAPGANTLGTLSSPVVSIKCSGSTLATANELSFNVTSMITAVTDGADTGVRLLANRTNLIQYLVNDTATSANLWPCAGGQINALGSGAAFALAGHTMYTILHIRASGYTVK